MAPIKFEEHIKEKLESRSLQPSSESWSALASRLDADEKKSKTTIFWWLSIAASVLILIAVSLQFFTADNSNIPTQQIVEKEKIEANSNAIKTPINNATTIIEDALVDTKFDNNKAQLNTLKKANQKPIHTTNKLSLIVDTQNTSASINKAPISNDKFKITDNTIIKNETEVVQLLEAVQEESKTLDKEVDSLLTLAQKELFQNQLQKETQKTVNAKQLLEEVEEDMGQSFRSKVFEALSNSYKTVKTAVVERNN